MYQTKISGQGLFKAQSKGYGQPVETFGSVDQGETPVSLLVIALASCVTMCVQGYFAKIEAKPDMQVTVSCQYEDNQFSFQIKLTETLLPDRKEAILTYIDERCRVKELLRSDLTYDFSFV